LESAELTFKLGSAELTTKLIEKKLENINTVMSSSYRVRT